MLSAADVIDAVAGDHAEIVGVVDIQRIAFSGHESSGSGLAVEVVALLPAVCGKDLHACAVHAQINFHRLFSGVQVIQVACTVISRCDVVAADKISCLSSLTGLSGSSFCFVMPGL